jgi:hypothetical protein
VDRKTERKDVFRDYMAMKSDDKKIWRTLGKRSEVFSDHMDRTRGDVKRRETSVCFVSKQHMRFNE